MGLVKGFSFFTWDHFLGFCFLKGGDAEWGGVGNVCLRYANGCSLPIGMQKKFKLNLSMRESHLHLHLPSCVSFRDLPAHRNPASTG